MLVCAILTRKVIEHSLSDKYSLLLLCRLGMFLNIPQFTGSAEYSELLTYRTYS